MMKALLVGCGYWGQNWAKTLYRLDALGAICEPSPHIQQALRQNYPDVPLYEDLQQALSQADAQVVVIATPVPTHLQVASTCLMARKHVLVEKPLTLTTDDAATLVHLAEENHVTLAVGHLLMYHPALLKLRGLIRDGILGDILSVQCTRINMGKVRNEENCWWSLAPHDISILSMLLGEPFEPVSALKMNPLQRDIEDTVIVNFATPSGKTALIHNSWLSPVKKHETVVIGSRKIAVFEDTLPAEKKLTLIDYDLAREGDIVQDIRKGSSLAVEYHADDELLAMEAKAFLTAAEHNSPLDNDGRNGLQVVQILEQVQSMLDRQPAPFAKV